MVAFNDPNLHSKFYVQILNHFEDISKLLLFFYTCVAAVTNSKISFGNIEVHHLRVSKLQTTSHHLKLFKKYCSFKIKKFPDIFEVKSIDLSMINFNRVVGFLIFSSKFYVAKSSCLNVIGKKLFFYHP